MNDLLGRDFLFGTGCYFWAILAVIEVILDCVTGGGVTPASACIPVPKCEGSPTPRTKTCPWGPQYGGTRAID